MYYSYYLVLGKNNQLLKLTNNLKQYGATYVLHYWQPCAYKFSAFSWFFSHLLMLICTKSIYF